MAMASARAGTASTGASPRGADVSRGALTAAALACGGVAPRAGRPLARGASVAPRASNDNASPIADSVFNVATEKLPGGDKLTNEGILAFFLAGIAAFWLGGTAIKTFAVMIGFLFTAVKYMAMGIALVLIGIAAS